MENKQLTPVEWLMNELANSGILITKDIDNLVAYHKAKQIEKKQTEISDEEIEKQSKYWNETTNPDMWTFKLAWKAGAKWYREQLKNK